MLRLRFVLDSAYASGQRASEPVGAIKTGTRHGSRLHLIRKAGKG